MPIKSKAASQTPAIQVLPINTKGNDILVGDIHGSMESLMLLIATLKDQDRLIIVGDLTDRGPGSFEVVKTIIEFNQIRKRHGFPEIQVARGNHEDIFLDYYYGRNNHLFHPNIGGDWVNALSPDELKLVADYFSSLPYILHVPGEDPFNVVHADMPISDAELSNRINSKNFTLSDTEKSHATWAREGTDVVGENRDVTSIPTYCGHTIQAGVRINSNHINLDVGSYAIENVCLVEHQTKQCKLIGNPEKRSQILDDGLSAVVIQKDINMHLDLLPYIKKIVIIANDATLKDKPQKIDAVVHDYVNKYKNQNYDLRVLYQITLGLVLDAMKNSQQHSAAPQSKQPVVSLQPQTAPVVENPLVTKIKDLNQGNAQDKAKQIDEIILQMAPELMKTGRSIKDAYVMVLRDDVAHLLSKETKDALGSYLKTVKNHKLLETDHYLKLFGSKSPEKSVRFINKALTVLDVSHIEPVDKENVRPSSVPNAGGGGT